MWIEDFLAERKIEVSVNPIQLGRFWPSYGWGGVNLARGWIMSYIFRNKCVSGIKLGTDLK